MFWCFNTLKVRKVTDMLDKAQQKEKRVTWHTRLNGNTSKGMKKNVLNNKMAHPNSWRMTGGDGVGKG